jgi:D-glycero-D-manno-heptose 1,7-bisphosphate phosphatase
MSNKTIFLDRDGVVNKDINYLYKIDDFVFIDGIFEVCKHFQKLSYKIIIVTNQSGIYRNFYSEIEYKKITQWMVSQFQKNKISILDVFHCPHGPKSNCSCRKPSPGMLINAQNKYNLDMKSSWLIGDKESDIIAAELAGISNTILFNESNENLNIESKAKFVISSLNQTKAIITS